MQIHLSNAVFWLIDSQFKCQLDVNMKTKSIMTHRRFIDLRWISGGGLLRFLLSRQSDDSKMSCLLLWLFFFFFPIPPKEASQKLIQTHKNTIFTKHDSLPKNHRRETLQRSSVKTTRPGELTWQQFGVWQSNALYPFKLCGLSGVHWGLSQAIPFLWVAYNQGSSLMLVPFDLLGRSLMSNLWSDWPALIGRKHFCPYLSLGSLFRVNFTTEKTNKKIILNLIFFYFIVHTDICSFDHFMILFSVLLRRSLLFYTDLLCHHELYRGNQKTNSAFLSVVANDQRGCN